MKYFITGATGFIGSHLINYLGSQGHEITAIYRKHTNTRIELSFPPIWIQRELDQITINDLEGHDVLVHLAAAGMPNNPEKVSFSEMFYYNVTCLVKLLETAKISGIKKIILCSSFKEYGWACNNYDFIPIDAPLLPATPFACSRVSGYHAALSFSLAYVDINIDYVRFFNIYGEGENSLDLWTSIKDSAVNGKDFAMTEGQQIRDYLHVSSAVKQLEQISLNSTNNGFNISHIASGTPIKLKDFADYWWKYWNASGKIHYGKLPYRRYEGMRIVAKV